MRTRKTRNAPGSGNRVEFSGSGGRSRSLARRLRPRLLNAMKRLKLTRSDLSVAFVSDRQIRMLNRRYRRKDRPTDVLSFTLDERSATGRRILGDIAISLPTARRQAREDRKPFDHECILLAIHGLLHLLGHDHEEPDDAAAMFRIQDRLVMRAIDELE